MSLEHHSTSKYVELSELSEIATQNWYLDAGLEKLEYRGYDSAGIFVTEKF